MKKEDPMDELKKSKKVQVAEELEINSDVQTIQETEVEETAEIHKAKKPHSHKHKEVKSLPNISQKFRKVTHRTLSTTERIIKSLSNAYEHIFVDDGSSNLLFEKDMGLKEFSKGNYKLALQHFESCSQNGEANDADTLYMMAICFVSQEQHKKATEYFYRADELKPNDYDILTSFSRCLLALERYDDAMIYLKKALAINPDEADLYYHCANCLEKNDEIEEAKKMYKKAIDLDPREPVYYHALGFLYENIGDHKDAIVCFKKAMDLERQRGGIGGGY
ncbi:MAG: tetratricopeptide repeat protein [Candidatus Omnitrophica bacterium]|nr:tetratricopeptide repeat protein [Candidatus Omnitrophota bacterium]